MPNWCYTSYRIQGDLKEIKSFHKLIQSLQKRKKPLVPNGFGNLWLGGIIHKLQGDWKKVYCRGSIIDYQFIDDDGTLSISTETAWSEMDEWRHFIESKYPSFKIYYMSEEEGCDYFVSNDKDGVFYPDRYYLEDETSESLYFPTLREAIEVIHDNYGITATTVKEIQDALEDYSNAHNDIYIRFREYTVVDD